MEYREILEKYGIYRFIQNQEWKKRKKKKRVRYAYNYLKCMIMNSNCSDRKKVKMIHYLRMLR